MPTMKDVAERAGVSTMTVSHVINGHPNVRESTRVRVEAAVAELGYRVNATARSLRRGRSGVIGLAVPQVDRAYFGLLTGLLIDRVAVEGFDLVVEQTGARREGELGAVEHARRRGYDGLIVSAVGLSDEDVAGLRGDPPVVVLGELGLEAPVDRVVMDNAAGAGLAVDRLVAVGCRRIAMLGGRSRDGIADAASARADGYRVALERGGLPFDARLLLDADYSLQGGADAVRTLIQNGAAFDGLFCATDLVAFGAIRALADAGIRVPQDVRLVGFDDVPMCAFTTPSLTSVRPDHEGMADAALAMIVERIDGSRSAAQARLVVAGATLTVRESA